MSTFKTIARSKQEKQPAKVKTNEKNTQNEKQKPFGLLSTERSRMYMLQPVWTRSCANARTKKEEKKPHRIEQGYIASWRQSLEKGLPILLVVCALVLASAETTLWDCSVAFLCVWLYYFSVLFRKIGKAFVLARRAAEGARVASVGAVSLMVLFEDVGGQTEHEQKKSGNSLQFKCSKIWFSIRCKVPKLTHIQTSNRIVRLCKQLRVKRATIWENTITSPQIDVLLGWRILEGEPKPSR